MKPVKEKIKVIDLDRGYFECNNSCDTCKKNCKLIKKLMRSSK